MELEAGQKVGDYEILGLLGTGGMGQVYRVRNRLTDRNEAMKVLLPQTNDEPQTEARFMAEIRILAGFSHPNIAQLYTAFHIEDQLVMMMELVDGETIKQKAKQGCIPQEEAVTYVLQLLTALRYAHTRGVIHRDVKPANLMVTSTGLLKLMDFGLARSDVQERLTRPGMTVGSLPYMSPEQMRGGIVDPRADLYSTGIVLYELLAGRRPFYTNGVHSLAHQQLHVDPQPPMELNPQISRSLNDIILMSLAKDPDKRFQTAEAFARGLHAVTSGPHRPKHAPSHQAAEPAKPVVHRQASSDRVASVFLTPATVAPSVARAAKPVLHTESTRPSSPSFWKRAGWVVSGAMAMLVAAGAVVEIPRFLKTNTAANSGTENGATTSAGTIPGTVDQDLANVRKQMDVLESRDETLHARLVRPPPSGGVKARRALDRQYQQMHSHLQIAESDLKNGDIVATRKEMRIAQKEMSGLESNLSQ